VRSARKGEGQDKVFPLPIIPLGQSGFQFGFDFQHKGEFRWYPDTGDYLPCHEPVKDNPLLKDHDVG